MAMALIRLQKYNVISVDWEAGAEPPFKQAASNARVVALEIITFIKHVKVRPFRLSQWMANSLHNHVLS